MELTKKELAFVDAMLNIGGVPEEATIRFIADGDLGKYSGHYTTLSDCLLMFNFAIEYERQRCMAICEGVGDDGLDGHHAADAISKGE